MAADAARESGHHEAGTLLHIHVSLKGRTVRSFTFSHEEITVGRDPDADIFLDNVGVSRAHARFERTPAGYVIEDLGSANGTFLNDRPVQRNLLNDDDVIQIGKYALRVSEREDRRANEADRPAGPAALEHTTVLTRDQVARVLTSSHAQERTGAGGDDSPAEVPSRRFGRVVAVVVACVLSGALGAAVVVFLMR